VLFFSSGPLATSLLHLFLLLATTFPLYRVFVCLRFLERIVAFLAFVFFYFFCCAVTCYCYLYWVFFSFCLSLAWGCFCILSDWFVFLCYSGSLSTKLSPNWNHRGKGVGIIQTVD
jgi:hypothetical protein